jgi:pSer/pThr/pTyr-binding forkhead associated (FHA) protein
VGDKSVDYLTLGELKSLVSFKGEVALERLYEADPVLVIRLNEESQVEMFNTPLSTPRPTESVPRAVDGTVVIEGTGLRDLVTRPASRVVRVKKTERNPFAGLVTIGRARNNDVRLFSDQISKMHGWLRQGPEGWVIKDHNSTNGTFVNGQRIQGGTEAPLRSGDELRLGDLGALFLDLAGLHALCGMVGD